MSDYSIDYGYENIKHTKTKEYFSEVMQSYVNGSYRSAVVMLYSVVISDLIYKLKDLKDIYEDKKAIEILGLVEKRQKQNPKSSEWEVFLIEEVIKKTALLESIDQVNLEHLRSQRHLSAHPVLNAEDLLSTPNKETVRALMRSMLEGLLTKGAVMGTEIFDQFINDLANHNNYFINIENLEKFLEARYFKNIHDRVIIKIFRSLWSITFKVQDENSTKNRNINYLALKIIYKKYQSKLKEYIKSESEYFSRSFNVAEGNTSDFLFAMLGSFPEIYTEMSKDSQGLLKVKSDNEWNLKVKSLFLADDFSAHITLLIDELYAGKYKNYDLSLNNIKLLIDWSEKAGHRQLLNELLIKYYVHSGTFDSATANYEKFIKPYLNTFNALNLENLLKGINGNTQCHNHRYAIQHNHEVRDRALYLKVDFDYETRFPHVRFPEEDVFFEEGDFA